MPLAGPLAMAKDYSSVTARVKECFQQYGYVTAWGFPLGKRTTSNRMQQAMTRGAVMHGRAELFDAFQAITNAVPGSQLAQFAMSTLRRADDVLVT